MRISVCFISFHSFCKRVSFIKRLNWKWFSFFTLIRFGAMREDQGKGFEVAHEAFHKTFTWLDLLSLQSDWYVKVAALIKVKIVCQLHLKLHTVPLRTYIKFFVFLAVHPCIILFKWSQLDAHNFLVYLSQLLYMFRAAMCTSSGELTVWVAVCCSRPDSHPYRVKNTTVA